MIVFRIKQDPHHAQSIRFCRNGVQISSRLIEAASEIGINRYVSHSDLQTNYVIRWTLASGENALPLSWLVKRSLLSFPFFSPRRVARCSLNVEPPNFDAFISHPPVFGPRPLSRSSSSWQFRVSAPSHRQLVLTTALRVKLVLVSNFCWQVS
jgi:hypothetical protein